MSAIEDNLKLLPNDKVKNALNTILENNLGPKFNLTVESGSSKGDNYIGVVYRAKALQSNDSENEMSVIIKVPPQNEVRRKQFFARPCFLRESLAYDDIIPRFMEFQKSKGIVPNENGWHEVSECYQTLTEENYEAIFLKDLKPDGFEMFSRFENVGVEHVKLVVQILAKFHAISFALKDQKPKEFEKYQQLDDIITSRKDDTFKSYFEELKSRALDTLNEEDNEVSEKVKKAFGTSSYSDLLSNLTNGELSEPYSVICHGDCWNNNVLFKNENGKPVEARLIDWQIARYASPVCDITYYIFGSTTKELRDEYYEEIIDTYYDQLASFLQVLGSDPKTIFPRQALDQQLRHFGKFGMLMGMMLLPVITSHVDDIPDLDDLSEQLEAGLEIKGAFQASEKSQNVYKKKMRDCLVDMVKFGYI